MCEMSLKRRYTGGNVRAKAANGTIITSWTFKEADLTRVAPCDTTNDYDFTQMCAKQPLWRNSNNKYTLGGAGGGNQHLLGLVELGDHHNHNNTYTLKVSMRGVIHVPVWAFTNGEWTNGWHNRWGRVFELPDKGQNAIPVAPVDTDSLENMSPFGKRLIRVFFRI
jgi:hypothetical protein